MTLPANGQVRGLLLGLYRAITAAAILGAAGALWGMNERLAAIETHVEHVRANMDRFDARLTFVERRMTSGQEPVTSDQ